MEAVLRLNSRFFRFKAEPFLLRVILIRQLAEKDLFFPVQTPTGAGRRTGGIFGHRQRFKTRPRRTPEPSVGHPRRTLVKNRQSRPRLRQLQNRY